MKSLKRIILMGAALLTGLCACSTKSEKTAVSPADDNNAKKMIVCYFSATGTTANAAERLAKIAGADIYEITPEAKYTDADLDWRDSLSRSYVEMHNRNQRPAIVTDSLPAMKDYDVVFIGYPNWWNTHPTVVNTFIEVNDLQGKTIVPFMTSGGSDITNSEKELKESYPTLTFSKGLLMNDVSDTEIKEWVDALR